MEYMRKDEVLLFDGIALGICTGLHENPGATLWATGN